MVCRERRRIARNWSPLSQFVEVNALFFWKENAQCRHSRSLRFLPVLRRSLSRVPIDDAAVGQQHAQIAGRPLEINDRSPYWAAVGRKRHLRHFYALTHSPSNTLPIDPAESLAKRAFSCNKYVRGLVLPLVQYRDCFFQRDDHGLSLQSEIVAAVDASFGAASSNTNSYLPQLVNCKYLISGEEQEEAQQSFEPRIRLNKRRSFVRFAIGKITSINQQGQIAVRALERDLPGLW